MVGDIPVDLINEVMATIADPAAVPEVSQRSSPRRRCSRAKHKNPQSEAFVATFASEKPIGINLVVPKATSNKLP